MFEGLSVKKRWWCIRERRDGLAFPELIGGLSLEGGRAIGVLPVFSYVCGTGIMRSAMQMR